MDPSAVPVFLAGPFPVLHRKRINDPETAVELDVALIIGGLPTMIATTFFAYDDTWDRIAEALESGDARLGVAGVPHETESVVGTPLVFPSAYVGLECKNEERLVLTHIRGTDPGVAAEAFARRVMKGILRGSTPAELGKPVDE